MSERTTLCDGTINLFCGDAIDYYDEWERPTVIVSDGPYGVNGYPGDLLTPDDLAEWYEPHIKRWTEHATPLTTLWFWNTEVGWATVHPMLKKHGWEYVSCCIWDKGMSHVAGNVNTKTIRHLPVVTEVCAQYVKKPTFKIGDNELSMKEWLRYEWSRTGLPFRLTNEACGVKDAATRKYFTKCHLWYMPPAEAFEKISKYANEHGAENGKPYFSINGETPIETTSDKNDVVWDPFAGLFTTAIASWKLERKCYCAERTPEVYNFGVNRVQAQLQNGFQCSF